MDNRINTCVFCRIVKGEIPCFKVWEDENHLAFLTPFGNTEGFTVVITKQHHSSYAFEVSEQVLSGLVVAAGKVARLIDKNMDDVGRTGLIFEGFGVDHLHAKLFPMHGTKMNEWKAIHSAMDKFFERYEGYISSHDCKPQKMDTEWLERIARKIRGEK